MGIRFSHDLVLMGPVSLPHSRSLFPIRAVSVIRLAVLASLGHFGIPPNHARPSPCLRLSLAFGGLCMFTDSQSVA